MKLTDFALVFVAAFLPIVIIAYVNTTFAVKSEKNEMYYRSIINSATQDAVAAMKEVEGSNIDYGYSGILNNKVSINAYEAINTFYTSLSRNFGINPESQTLERLKMYIPVIAVMDYDGIYIHSAEKINDEIKFITKPKVKYTLNYVIKKIGSALTGYEYQIMELTEEDKLNLYNDQLLSDYMYEVSFTMDDYVYLTIYSLYNNRGSVAVDKGFYLTDSNNNAELVFSNDILSHDERQLRSKVVEFLVSRRKDIISETVKQHITYAVNKHNEYAGAAGVKYEFKINIDSDSAFEETINGIGIITTIQGISLGNRYLNYKAYSTSELAETKKYYISGPLTNFESYESFLEAETYLKYKLYHTSRMCMVYKHYKENTENLLLPEYYLSKGDAATQGFYPCPICKP